MNNDFISKITSARPLYFKNIIIPTTFRMLVMAPHPDDFDAIGVTMKHLRDNGNSINVVVLTSGASGVEDEYAQKVKIEDKALIRQREQIESCRYFGLPIENLTFMKLELDEEGHLKESENNISMVKNYYNSILPDLVFLPHGHDSNKDHQKTYKLFKKILESEKRSIVAFLNQDPKTISMRFDILTEFGEEDAKWKGELLRFHNSQHQRNLRSRNHGFDERILRMNKETAMQFGIDNYLEAFEIELHQKKD